MRTVSRRFVLCGLALGGCGGAATSVLAPRKPASNAARLGGEEGANRAGGPLFPAANLSITRFGSRVPSLVSGDIADLRWRNRVYPPIGRGARRTNDAGGALNVRPGIRAGVDYSSWQKALRADCAQDAYAAGYPERGPWAKSQWGWKDFLDRDFHPMVAGSGFDTAAPGVVMTHDFAHDPANLERIFSMPTGPERGNFMVARDVVILPMGTVKDVPGGRATWFYGDEEADDGRGEAAYLLSVAMRSHIAHSVGLKYCISFDPMAGMGGRLGMTQNNGAQILDLVDAAALPCTSRIFSVAENLDGQCEIFTGPRGDVPVNYRKILVSMTIGAPPISVAQAAAAHRWIVDRDALGGVVIPGGSPMTADAGAPWTQAIQAFTG